MKLTLSISTCPNDTFMFDALIHKKIDYRGYDFDVTMEDIEQLNRHALQGQSDISKISYALYPKIAKEYLLSTSGSALGWGNGPLLVSRHKIYPDEVPFVTIAIPGIYTTANALLDFSYEGIKNKKEYLFSDIAEAVMGGEADAGVLIHEQRFLYKKIGLLLIADLGEIWEQKTNLPIPLGAIAIRQSLEQKIKEEITSIIAESILYATNNPSSSWDFVKKHAKETDDRIIEQHIKMFVTNESLTLSLEGQNAVRRVLGGAFQDEPIFVEQNKK